MFPVFRKRAEVAVATSGDQEDVVSVSEIGFDAPLSSHFLLPIWEGVWPYLDPWDSVCLRTASVEWDVPGKYGPHGELFFVLI